MISAAIDTNCFLRFLMGDVPIQTRAIEKRFRQAKNNEINLVTFAFTVVEVLFQLENWYKLSKIEAATMLTPIVSTSWVQIENKTAILSTLDHYKNVNIDFVDILLNSISEVQGLQVLSFDKHFDKLSPKLRLEP